MTYTEKIQPPTLDNSVMSLEQIEIKPVLKGINTLYEILKGFRKKPSVLLFAEPVLDGFQKEAFLANLNISTIINEHNFSNSVIEREGGIKLRITPDEFECLNIDLNDFKWNLGGGVNVLEGLRNFSNLHVVLSVSENDQFFTKIDNFLTEYKQKGINIIKLLRKGGNPVKIRINGGSIDVRPNGTIDNNKLLQTYRKLINVGVDFDSLVISDYGRGMFMNIENIVNEISQLTANQSKTQIFIDSRDSNLNIPGATIKPNCEEAEYSVGSALSSKELVYKFIKKFSNSKAILLTLDKDGAIYLDKDGNYIKTPPGLFFNTDFIASSTGAGDIVMATISLLHPYLNWNSVIQTAMILASYSISNPGTSTLSPELVTQVKELIEQSILYGDLTFSPLAFYNAYNDLSEKKSFITIKDLKSIGVDLASFDNSSLSCFLYPDVNEFMKKVAASKSRFSIWTKGEIYDETGELGYQAWKIKLSGLNEYRIIGGPDKKCELLKELSAVNTFDYNRFIFIDDKATNLIEIYEALKKYIIDITRVNLILVDREEKNAFLNKPLPKNIVSVKSLTEIEIPYHSEVFCDLDYTLLDHEALRMELSKQFCNFNK